MLREADEDDRPSMQPAERGAGGGGSPPSFVYDDDDDGDDSDDACELEGGAAWRPRGRCGSGALLLIRGGSVDSSRSRSSSMGEGGHVEEGSQEEVEVEVALDVFDPTQQEDEDEVLFVVGPSGAVGGGVDKARRMKTEAAGAGARGKGTAARHHRLGGGMDGGLGGAQRGQQQHYHQTRRRRRLVLGAGAAAAALLLVVGAVAAAGGQASRLAPPPPLPLQGQAPVNYDVASVPVPASSGDAAVRVGPRPPPPPPLEPVLPLPASENATVPQGVIEENEAAAAVKGAAAVAAAVVDGHNNRTRALRGVIATTSSASSRPQWPRRISDHLGANNNAQPPPCLEVEEAEAPPPKPLGMVLRGWLRDAAHDGRRRREAWRSAWARVAALLAAVVDGVERQGEGPATVVTESPLAGGKVEGVSK